MLMALYRIGMISDFRMLVHNPVATSKVYSKCYRLAMSDAMGLTNRTVSSTYKLVCVRTRSTLIGCSKPYCVAVSSTR
jgi:hypothetical protein